MSDHTPAYDRWLRADCSDFTVDRRLGFLAYADRHLPAGLEKATTDQLAALLGTRGWSPWTRYTYHNHFRSYYRWELAAGLRDADPTAGLRRPRPGAKLPKPITSDQLRLLLSSTPAPWPLVFLLAAYAGLRASEIAELHTDEVTCESMRIVGKGGRIRIVDTHPLIWAAVAPLPPGRVVLDARGAPMTGRQLSMRASAMIRRQGLRGIWLHRGRHWFATTMYRAGVDVLVIQELMGHASVATTLIYTQLDDARRRAAVRALPVVTELAA